MGRTFAGILAMVGTTVVLIEAIRYGADLDSAMIAVIGWSMALAAGGWLIGVLAQQTVDESVKSTLEAELAAVNRTDAPPAEGAAS